MPSSQRSLIVTVALACASAAAADAPALTRSLVVHVPPMASAPDVPIELEAMLDAPFAETLAVRLQWDTAPPFLMAASIVRTDLPGAEIDSAGLYLGYDIAYPIANRFSIKAQVSYGSRGGAANVGGGLGTALDF